MGFAHEAGKGSRIRSSEDKKKFEEGWDRIWGKKGFDISWAAGIIEGEGCFNFYKDKRSNYHATRIVVEMTDLDTIQKLQEVLGGKYVECNSPSQHGKKKSWRWYINKQKEVFDCLLMIMPYLSERRLAKARELFDYLEPKVVK